MHGIELMSQLPDNVLDEICDPKCDKWRLVSKWFNRYEKSFLLSDLDLNGTVVIGNRFDNHDLLNGK